MLVPISVFAARKIADVSSSCYALGGVLFERDKEWQPYAVATDGRRLVALTWREDNAAEYPGTAALGVDPSPLPFDEFKPFILPVAACDKASKMKVKTTKPILRNVVLDEHAAAGCPNDITVFSTDMENHNRTTARQVEGRFPRWRDAIPAYGPDDISITVDGRFLRECAEVLLAHAGDEDTRGITLTIRRDEKHWQHPLLLTKVAPDGRKAAAIIMPLASNDENVPTVPAWQFHPIAAAALEPIVEPIPEEPSDLESPADTDLEPSVAACDTILEPVAVVEVTEPAPVAEQPEPPEPAADRFADSFAAAPVVRRPRKFRSKPVSLAGSLKSSGIVGRNCPEPPPEPAAEPVAARRRKTISPPAPDWRENARRISLAAYV